MKTLVLWGPPGVGKSTLARALADKLQATVFDSDALIAKEAGVSIPELFAREGEAGFRVREKRIVLSLLEEATQRSSRSILALGGGALLQRSLRRMVLRRAFVLGLTAPFSVLLQRSSTGARPLLGGEEQAEERLETLLELRREAYAEAHATVDTTSAVETVVQRSIDAMQLFSTGSTVIVPLGERTYPVRFAPLQEFPSFFSHAVPQCSGVILLGDRGCKKAPGVVAQLGLSSVRAERWLPSRGDENKNAEQLQRIWDLALRASIDRQAAVVAIGGGALTDLAGFAAGTLLRGVRSVLLPTTLLAMADASVGGKTAIDHSRGKNLIGVLQQPRLVWCDVSTLATLPARQWKAGLAELVKIALIRDRTLLDQIEERAELLCNGSIAALAEVLPRGVQAKADVVAEDETEQAVRALLNFGHTIGHGIEHAAHYQLPHGEAVALGMRAALWLGVRVGVTPQALQIRAETLFDRLGFPKRATGLKLHSVTRALENDKKRRNGAHRFVLCREAGEGEVREISAHDAEQAIESVL